MTLLWPLVHVCMQEVTICCLLINSAVYFGVNYLLGCVHLSQTTVVVLAMFGIVFIKAVNAVMPASLQHCHHVSIRCTTGTLQFSQCISNIAFYSILVHTWVNSSLSFR